jgi:hypothetical protein
MNKRIFISSGLKTFYIKKTRIQFYYPQIILYNNECFLKFDTSFRIVFGNDYYGFGFNLFGFGIGCDLETK